MTRLENAFVSGQMMRNPARYRNPGIPLGDPLAFLDGRERTIWTREASCRPWLRAHHAAVFAAWCCLCRMFEDGEDSAQMHGALSQYARMINQ
jgi:hypothetical protein